MTNRDVIALSEISVELRGYIHQIAYHIPCSFMVESSRSGVARGQGGICPRAPPGGGRQNPAKELDWLALHLKFGSVYF